MPELIRIGPLELRFLCSKHDTGGSLDLFEMTVPSSGRMPVPHYHRDWDETVYGLTGTVTFTVDGEPHAVGPGESLFIPCGVVHGFDNRSGAMATCLGVLTPDPLGTRRPPADRMPPPRWNSGPGAPQKLPVSSRAQACARLREADCNDAFGLMRRKVLRGGRGHPPTRSSVAG